MVGYDANYLVYCFNKRFRIKYTTYLILWEHFTIGFNSLTLVTELGIMNKLGGDFLRLCNLKI